MVSEDDPINQKIAENLSAANIPIVLIDRDIVMFPERSRFDLVGIDNIRAGYLMTRHLIHLGCKKVDFLDRPGFAPTAYQRIFGYEKALQESGIFPEGDWVHMGDPGDAKFVDRICTEKNARAIVCANDVVAAKLMSALDSLNIRVPEDVRVVGVDNVKYAEHLRVPLTTYHQPCAEVGTVAVNTMINRISKADLPPQHIQLKGDIIVRRSCGHPNPV